MPSLLPSNAIPEALISIGSGSIGTDYSFAGQFAGPIELLAFTSVLNEVVLISFDGVTDHLCIPPVFTAFTDQSLTVLNFKKNLMTLPSYPIYVKQLDGFASGTLYITSFSARIN